MNYCDSHVFFSMVNTYGAAILGFHEGPVYVKVHVRQCFSKLWHTASLPRRAVQKFGRRNFWFVGLQTSCLHFPALFLIASANGRGIFCEIVSGSASLFLFSLLLDTCLSYLSGGLLCVQFLNARSSYSGSFSHSLHLSGNHKISSFV